MTRYFDCSDPAARSAGLEEAASAVRRGELVVLPTDTVYGLGADAFDPGAVAALLAAKGRGRHKPSPVLVDSVDALRELVDDLPGEALDLIDAFWPGGLTLVVRHRPSLGWDLGETGGTVAVRMPDHPLALDLLAATGPLAVSSANLTDRPSPQDCVTARGMLGDSVSVYLDGGRTAGAVSSSIIDLSGTTPVLVRDGVLPASRLRAVASGLVVP
ncbi:L-threonylcarbamoyladenylate synthase [Streptomyces lavendofoliae]|uniref:L-threonylcarbamoyladenylate synthase n=1 Tax=Streptomyces lavendofoliae TaxID=67314 RepID=A0A918HTM4_9ACTN|nr:L-threonylcarbamoyladenylate synthase [Streptomyces lavendofoliae]GGU25915.1 threonylcarbamoyl-AMP synthase [Streptomyces lavendofoliae]